MNNHWDTVAVIFLLVVAFVLSWLFMKDDDDRR